MQRGLLACGWFFIASAIGVAAFPESGNPQPASPRPVPSWVRTAFGLGGPLGRGGIRALWHAAERLTVGGGVGVSPLGATAGILAELGLWRANCGVLIHETNGRHCRPEGRVYAGATQQYKYWEYEDITDSPRGMYTWIDIGLIGKNTVFEDVHLAAVTGFSILVAQPDGVDAIGEGDDDFSTLGWLGSPHWWVKEGFVPSLWMGIEF